MRTKVCIIKILKPLFLKKVRYIKTYFCIDLKTFYASVECVERGLDPFQTNLVVHILCWDESFPSQ